MPRTVRHAKLDTPTARGKLKRGRQPHWQALLPGSHLGYQRWPDDPQGRWLLRRYLAGGRYSNVEIGTADDRSPADGRTVLDCAQASIKARALLATPGKGKTLRMTVRQAVALYLDHKEAVGQDVAISVGQRAAAHILPALGDTLIEDLDPATLRRWLADIGRFTWAEATDQRWQAAIPPGTENRRGQAQAAQYCQPGPGDPQGSSQSRLR